MKLIKATKHQSNFHHFSFECDYKDEIKLFISSDWHFDNPKCNRKLLFKHLDQAVEQNAKIVVTGDLFCFMQGKYDPRGTKSDILPEHNKSNYLDVVINDTAEKLKPYAKHILLISRGNHETSVSRRAETDVMERFVERLNLIAGSSVKIGNYTGYYTLAFSRKKGSFKSLNIGYSHGNWGGIITKGTLSVVRQAAIMPDADVIFSGHTHDGWTMPQPRYKLHAQKKKVEIANQWHVKTGTYKEEFAQGKGWAVERIGMPKYLGGCFMHVTYNRDKDLEYTFTLTH